MRFGFLVVGAAAVGALSVTAVQGLVSPAAQSLSVTRALGFDPLKVHFTLADLNPLRLIYDEEMADIARGHTPAELGFPASKPIGRFVMPSATPGFKFDDAEMARTRGSSIVQQNQQFNNRMDDIRNYAQNPAGWHGAPPR
jgi:hypothetical protein